MTAFIVFEGVDGSGKTTLANKLAVDLEALFIATPPLLINSGDLRELIDSRSGAETRFLYYLLGDFLVSDTIKGVRKARFVVCDRYIHSTIVSFRLAGFDFDSNIDALLLALEKPDISFFLFVSQEIERRRRIEFRGRKTANDILLEDNEFQRKYVEYFLQRNDFYSIDTCGDTPEVSFEKIKKELRSRRLIT